MGFASQRFAKLFAVKDMPQNAVFTAISVVAHLSHPSHKYLLLTTVSWFMVWMVWMAVCGGPSMQLMLPLGARHRLLLSLLMYRQFGPSVFHLMMELVGIEPLQWIENIQLADSTLFSKGKKGTNSNSAVQIGTRNQLVFCTQTRRKKGSARICFLCGQF